MDGPARMQRHEVDLESGLLVGILHRSSPHQDARPGGAVPELIIIHGISLPPGEFGGPWIDRLFMGELDRSQHPYFAELPSVEVSAHLLIRRDGAVSQYVPFHRRAWHAGRSCYGDREACNDFSIGIELEGADDQPYEDAQYARLCGAIDALLQAYPSLSEDRIVGHDQVAPGRKTDPGSGFDWQHLRCRLEEQLAERRGHGQSVAMALGVAPGTETDG